MKATQTMAAETAVGAGILWKAGAALGAGVLGAAIMAAMDPPATRKELFQQACVSALGSMLFGPLAVRIINHFFPFLSDVGSLADYEVAIPIYFVVGALSWGLFGAIAKLRKIISENAAIALAKKFGVDPL